MPVLERLKAAFQGATIRLVRPDDRIGIQHALAEVDAAILQGPPRPQDLMHSNLKWVHIDQSGLDSVATHEVCNGDIMVTSSSGRSAPVLAEHAVFFMLALVYRWRSLARAHRRRVWGIKGYDTLLGLSGRHVLIVGWGHTGQALASRCQALGMRVSVFTRSKPDRPVAGIKVYSLAAGETIDQALQDVDILALCASLNDASYRMIGAKQLAQLNPGAFLINIARGDLVCPEALVSALKFKHLGGAGLDVAHREPMDPWDWIWSHRNVIVTPHITPKLADRAGRSVAIITENAALYRSDQPLLNQLGPLDTYSFQSAPTEAGPLQYLRATALNRISRRWRKIARLRID